MFFPVFLGVDCLCLLFVDPFIDSSVFWCLLCSVVVFCVAFGCGFPSCIVSVFLLVLAVVMGSFVLYCSRSLCILCCGCALDVWACVHSVLWLCIGCMGLCAFCVVVLLYVVCRLLLL